MGNGTWIGIMMLALGVILAGYVVYQIGRGDKENNDG